MVDEMINGLEQKISDLLNNYHYLKEERGNCKRELAEIGAEYQALKERYESLKVRHEQAVNGIERMIDRLKTVQEEA
ncbi:MAG: cell division protein ZapB [Gammaproteobacteria bacterium]|nr:cell division protein ZapB [Gammaproteobacteria bacterium]